MTSYSKCVSRSFTLLFILTSFLFAQTGTIEGFVFDSQNNDGLPGANVYLEGTSLGAAADVNGKFIIYNVPAGQYQLVVKYIGYLEKIVDVTVEDGQVLEQVITLDFQSIEGEVIEVTAQAEGQLQAVNEQLSARTIKNVVSSARIHELPDESAAAALSRLPGLSLQDGDKVVIRGIQAKQNTVLINGVRIPSTDMNDRSTNLGFISSNLLSGIEVIKVLTPDMDANAIGGVVNLRLREAPSGLHFDVFTQGNYNSQDHTTDNYKLWASISQRFLDDKLGLFIQGNADRSNVGQDRASAGFGILGEGEYGEARYQMNNFTFADQMNIYENKGFSVIMDYVLPKGKIVLQNTLTYNDNDNTSFRNNYVIDQNRGEYMISRDKYDRQLMINALQTEYNFGDLKVELSLSHSFTNKRTDLRYGDVGQPMYFYNTAAHPFGYIDGTTEPVSLFNDKTSLTLDDALDIPIDSSDALDASIQGWVVSRDEKFDQHAYDASLDFTYPFKFSSDVTTKFKFGGKFSRSTRENDVEANFNGSYDTDYYNTTRDFFPDHPGMNPNNPVLFRYLWDDNYLDDRGQYFLGGDYDFKFAYDKDLMDKYMIQSMKGWDPAEHVTNSKRDDYKGAEVFTAGYLMGDFNIGSDLTFLTGIRFEHYNMDYYSPFVYVTHGVYGYGIFPDTLNTVDRNDDNIFPNAQLRYKFTDWADVRIAYSKTISRPDFRAIRPNVYLEPGVSAQAGNTKLKPAISTNYDAFLSFYSDKIGLFTLGGFLKKIDDPFFSTSIFYQNLSYYKNVSFPGEEVWDALGFTAATARPNASLGISTFMNNPEPAFIRGLEFEWQTNFWYLPQPLNSLVLNINYTRAWSEMDYQQVRNTSIQHPRDAEHPRGWTEYITTDTLRTARLLNQGDHIVNVALGLDYKGFSGRISFRMQGDVITSVGARPEDDQFTGNIYRWDFTLNQKLPIEGLSVALNGVNVFHNVDETYRRFRRTEGGKISNYLSSIAYSPSIFQLNLRYSY